MIIYYAVIALLFSVAAGHVLSNHLTRPYEQSQLRNYLRSSHTTTKTLAEQPFFILQRNKNATNSSKSLAKRMWQPYNEPCPPPFINFPTQQITLSACDLSSSKPFFHIGIPAAKLPAIDLRLSQVVQESTNGNVTALFDLHPSTQLVYGPTIGAGEKASVRIFIEAQLRDSPCAYLHQVDFELRCSKTIAAQLSDLKKYSDFFDNANNKSAIVHSAVQEQQNPLESTTTSLPTTTIPRFLPNSDNNDKRYLDDESLAYLNRKKQRKRLDETERKTTFNVFATEQAMPSRPYMRRLPLEARSGSMTHLEPLDAVRLFLDAFVFGIGNVKVRG